MAPLTSGTAVDSGGAVTAAASFVGMVMELFFNVIRTGTHSPLLYYNLCLYFASGIDLAITNKEVPSRCSDIPPLLKLVHKHEKDYSFQTAFLVLMISIKSACKAGWFSNQDTEDLVLMTKEAMEGFSNPKDVEIGPSSALPYISNILSRYHPQMKIEKILLSLGVKAGFGAYVSDFQISRDTVTFQHEKICLFVALMENVEPSSHIVTTPQINLMLNGRKVQNEVKNYMDMGQQLITNVTAMLEDGVNLLQAIGQFNGNYVIALATTSTLPSSGDSELHYHSPPLVASFDSGSRHHRTSWLVSLICPISRRRIGIPVKGSLCKHPECFDYETFLAMNSKEPSWRCPHCKLPVGRTDLHVDLIFSKVLRESPKHVNDVVILEDGSWKLLSVRKDCLENNIRSSTTKGSVKPNNGPSNIRPSPVSLQHQSMNQPIVVQSQLPGRGSNGTTRPWVLHQNSNKPNEIVGKMRGSLIGQAYDAAFSHVMTPPIQPAQAPSRPPEYNLTKK